MPKEEWGVKRLCPTTQKRFYDLGRTPVVSPYTGEIVEVDLPGRKGLAPAPAVAKETRSPAAREVDSDEDLLVDDDAPDIDIEDELLEDEDDDNVALDDLADVAGDEEES